jgi:hypothetical protein
VALQSCYSWGFVIEVAVDLMLRRAELVFFLLFRVVCADRAAVSSMLCWDAMDDSVSLVKCALLEMMVCFW